MNKKRFKRFVVPTMYTIAIATFGTSMYFIQKVVNKNQFESNDNMEYVDKEIVTDNEYIPVVNEQLTILKPFSNESVTISKTFYNYEGESKNQENSIIFYENTYMQNTGIDYTLNQSFDIISILDGVVLEVTDNEILGKTIKIKHDNDLISTYQSLSEVKVKKDDTVIRGQVIGKSGTSSLYSKDYNLHFELCYQGKNVNPEEYYNKTKDEL